MDGHVSETALAKARFDSVCIPKCGWCSIPVPSDNCARDMQSVEVCMVCRTTILALLPAVASFAIFLPGVHEQCDKAGCRYDFAVNVLHHYVECAGLATCTFVSALHLSMCVTQDPMHAMIGGTTCVASTCVSVGIFESIGPRLHDNITTGEMLQTCVLSTAAASIVVCTVVFATYQEPMPETPPPLSACLSECLESSGHEVAVQIPHHERCDVCMSAIFWQTLLAWTPSALYAVLAISTFVPHCQHHGHLMACNDPFIEMSPACTCAFSAVFHMLMNFVNFVCDGGVSTQVQMVTGASCTTSCYTAIVMGVYNTLSYRIPGASVANVTFASAINLVCAYGCVLASTSLHMVRLQRSGVACDAC